MPLTDRDRLLGAAARPRILRLWWALQKLRSVVSFMNSGAHPDDETSAMLAALGLREGFALSYACANRGEGGQNDIGTEAGADLGVLRTAEMERAADVLDMRLYWLSQSPEDAIFDFGFSKSGTETLGHWGAERTLARFVDIVRRERPDILCPTFLDIPGQHGHHRAMTETAHRVMEAAADPGFTGSDRPAWQVAKLYLPAWSGAGQAYDDDLPPPPATITVKASDTEPVSGWSWEEIGQFSRLHHRTQAMGRWPGLAAGRDWPLHLAVSHVSAGAEDNIGYGLPTGLADLADGIQPLAAPLGNAATQMQAAIAAFPDVEAICTHAAAALNAVRSARDACPPSMGDSILHRLDRKETQLSRVLGLATGLEGVALADADFLRPGESCGLTIESRSGMADNLAITLDLPMGWQQCDAGIAIAPESPATDPYPDFHDPAAPQAPALVLRAESAGTSFEIRKAFDARPVILPATGARPVPDRALLNLTTDDRALSLSIADIYPEGAPVSLQLPEGWRADRTGDGFRVSAPGDLGEGLYRIGIETGDSPALTTHRILHEGMKPLARNLSAEVRIRALNASLPKARIAYIGAGNDRVAEWLAAIGQDVAVLGDADLAAERPFDGYDSVLVGIFAFRFRPALARARPKLHEWITAGGNLVTLYHRPWDNWDPEETPPSRLEIGQPSLRWRVTDAEADVTCLDPDHPLMTTPNRIGPEDWAGWHKERGLYFAKSWDPAYEPLLEMADPGEAPHRGALLSARIGSGRHSHCALILHHQMEHLVPGAFRLMANLLAPAS